MPRVITREEAKRLGGVPVARRVMSRADAEAAGGVAIESDAEGRIKELGGVKQPDGTYLVPGENGGPALRLDAQANPVGGPIQTGSDEATGLENAVATLGSAALPVIPQAKGIEAALGTIGTDKSAGDAYRKGRDETKRTIQQAKDKAGFIPQLAGAVLSGGIAAPETILGRVGLSAGLSAAGQALDSNVDLTKLSCSLK